nr:hypothetical protein [Alysiella crassa]UOP06095.1 hypothetical protein LVJ80_09660 [Alysiella crassa]
MAQKFMIGLSCLGLAACMAGGGYMRVFQKNVTTTFPSFKDTTLHEKERALLQEYIGDYQVQQSWGNPLEKMALAKIRLDNNKVSLSVYPKDWTVPSFKIEFEMCHIVTSDDKYIRLKKVKQHLKCYGKSSDGFGTSLEIAKPSTESTGFSPNLEMFTSILVEGRQVPINQFEYALSYQGWHDEPAPLLGLKKIK